MNKLILHVGPGKCGSSSIQNFFMKHKNTCIEKINFVFLDPKEIAKINSAEPSKDSANYFTQLIKSSIERNSVIILSHEIFFNKPSAIKNICAIAKNITGIDEILIIGYSRRQSEFMVSAYSQWLFRSPERIQEIKSTMRNIGIEPTQFSGLERQLIGSIINDFYSARHLSDDTILDWNKQYMEIENLTSPFGVNVKCGVLPNKQSDKNLIEDFCTKSSLTLRSEVKGLTNIRSNLKFDNEMIEAVNIATDLGLNVPTPHRDNNFFTRNSIITKHVDSLDDSLILILKQYIDCYYIESNIEFCRKYDLDKSYFEVSKQYSKGETLNAVKTEQLIRKKNDVMVDRYKNLIGIMAESLYHNYKMETIKQPPAQYFSIKNIFKLIKRKY